MNDPTILNNQIGAALDYWRSKLPVTAPDRQQFAVWLTEHGLDALCFAVDQTARKCSSLDGQMTPLHARRFVSAVCRRIHSEKAIEAVSTKV